MIVISLNDLYANFQNGDAGAETTSVNLVGALSTLGSTTASLTTLSFGT